MIDNWNKINSDDFKHQYYYNGDNNILHISKIDKETTELVDLIGQYSRDGKTLINIFRTIKFMIQMVRLKNILKNSSRNIIFNMTNKSILLKF